MLNQGVNGNSEKSAEKPEDSQLTGDGQETQVRTREQRTLDRDTDCAEWDQAVFNFAARKNAGGEAACSDPERKRGEQQARLSAVRPQNVCGVQHNVQKKQRG